MTPDQREPEQHCDHECVCAVLAVGGIEGDTSPCDFGGCLHDTRRTPAPQQPDDTRLPDICPMWLSPGDPEGTVGTCEIATCECRYPKKEYYVPCLKGRLFSQQPDYSAIINSVRSKHEQPPTVPGVERDE